MDQKARSRRVQARDQYQRKSSRVSQQALASIRRANKEKVNTMRKFMIVGLLLTLYGGLLLSFPKRTMSTTQPASRAESTQDLAVTGTILRTLVYHEITALSQSAIAERPQAFPLLSKNGNRAVFNT